MRADPSLICHPHEIERRNQSPERVEQRRPAHPEQLLPLQQLDHVEKGAVHISCHLGLVGDDIVEVLVADKGIVMVLHQVPVGDRRGITGREEVHLVQVQGLGREPGDPVCGSLVLVSHGSR